MATAHVLMSPQHINTVFSVAFDNVRLVPGKVLAAEKRLINLDLATRRSFVRLCSPVCY